MGSFVAARGLCVVVHGPQGAWALHLRHTALWLWCAGSRVHGLLLEVHGLSGFGVRAPGCMGSYLRHTGSLVLVRGLQGAWAPT